MRQNLWPNALAKLCGAALGISQTVYSRFERGYQTISVIHLLKLADYYQVSTDYILGRINNSKPYSAK